MPGFGDRLGEDERWDLINFLRTLAAAEQARVLAPVVRSRAAGVVAPDFTYTTGVGEERSLKDHRGQRLVLLVFFTLPGSAERLGQLAAAAPADRGSGRWCWACPPARPATSTARSAAGRSSSRSPWTARPTRRAAYRSSVSTCRRRATGRSRRRSSTWSCSSTARATSAPAGSRGTARPMAGPTRPAPRGGRPPRARGARAPRWPTTTCTEAVRLP